MLDDLDRRLLDILVQDSRTSLKDLAQQVGMFANANRAQFPVLRSAHYLPMMSPKSSVSIDIGAK